MNVSRNILCRIFSAALILAAAAVHGQGFIKTYQPLGASARTLVQADDGGYFMAGEIPATGQMFLQKTNATGNAVWTNHLALGGARALASCKVAGGGFVVLAENFADVNGTQNLVFKISDSGTVLWQTVVGNTFLPNGLKDIIATSDGHFLAAGNTRDAQLNLDAWLVKFTPDGNILWSQTVTNTAFNEEVSSLVELPGGYVAISGGGVHNGDRDLFLVKTDPSGNLVWQKWYDKPATQIAYDLLRMADGGLMVLGDTYGTDPTKITLLKTDADGTEDFFAQLFPWPTSGNNPLYTLNSFVRDAADNVYITGYGTSTLTDGSTFLLKLDALGDYVWIKGLGHSDIPWQIINTSDNKFAICGGFEWGAFLIKANEQGEIYTNKIAGNLYHDANDNCAEDTGEPALTSFIIRAENQSGEVFFKNSAPDGTFLIPVSEGDFALTVSPVYGSQYFWHICDTQTVSVTGEYQTVQADPLGLRSEADCPQMYVEIGAPFLRRCFSNTFNVLYCNNGNVGATDASVALTLSDPLLLYETSSIPLTNQNGNVLIFNIPDVAPGECGAFTVKLIVDCAAELGEVLCVEAHIFPDTVCPAPDPSWDGSHLEVTGTCDGSVQFTITNTGTGDMAGTVEYVIVEDQIMYMQGSLQLDAGEDTVITVPNPSGGPYFLQTAQSPGHPGLNVPSAIVSPCGGPAMSSALQFPNNEADPFISVYCDEVVGSYDPNDKRGFPLGWKDAHYIERAQELEYMIRFQNTGTDTAFLVVIRDTLTTLLDATTLRPGSASHPYTWTLDGAGVLTFRFEDILLVDSFTNEPASHGYVTFSIAQQPGLPLGTVIENKAEIYFDFNEAVVTNTYFHTIGKPFSTFLKDPPQGNSDLQIFPHPFAEQALFRLNGVASNAFVRLAVFDAMGRLVKEDAFTGSEYLFQNKNLTPGIYFFKIEENGRLLASGKVVIGH
ncbi:MAG: T9SS C-terminal target domain-containing protein [Haliscomenobacteraceae bacterium CHB4]|nr:hypothetical protein [Saprospiraceae bacterium]MCE7926759.1 T9SS C-terminal target domain-containing protein [Haliscomenobacteraceae bacterium CHB4]